MILSNFLAISLARPRVLAGLPLRFSPRDISDQGFSFRPTNLRQGEEENMKLVKLSFAVACLLTLVASGFAQTADASQSKKTFGYVDTKTGLFHPLTRAIQSEESRAAITPTTGKFVFNVTITVSSALPTSAVIVCEVVGGVADATSGEFSNDVVVTATRSGNTASCPVTVNYSWDLASPTKDTVEFDLTVTATTGTVGGENFSQETFIAPAVTAKVPANGATTTETVATTI
jgi:hypothetical protein